MQRSLARSAQEVTWVNHLCCPWWRRRSFPAALQFLYRNVNDAIRTIWGSLLNVSEASFLGCDTSWAFQTAGLDIINQLLWRATLRPHTPTLRQRTTLESANLARNLARGTRYGTCDSRSTLGDGLYATRYRFAT